MAMCEIFMTKQFTYALEGSDVAEVWASRAGSCEEAVVVSWTIVGKDCGGGTAIEGEHYTKRTGEFVFAPGSNISSHPATVPLISAEFWEPLREFTVCLESVVTGPALIGKLTSTVVTIVEKDLFPIKVPRVGEYAGSEGDPLIQFSDKFLTPSEIDDWPLIWGFLLDRYARCWPSSAMCSIYKLLQGLFPTILAFLGIQLIDKVFNEDFAGSAKRRFEWAVGLGLALFALPAIKGLMEYHYNDLVGGLSLRGDIRKWVVAQMLWVDEESFSRELTPAAFLHAATTAADTLASCWVSSFTLHRALVEVAAGSVGLLYLHPIGCLMFMAILLFAWVLHLLRGSGQRRLAEEKERCKRCWLATLEDIVINASLYRHASCMAKGKLKHAERVDRFHDAQADAWIHTDWTSWFVGCASGLIYAALIALLAIRVEKQETTAGEAVAILAILKSASASVREISDLLLDMRSASASIRDVAAICNHPTDAFKRATELDSNAPATLEPGVESGVVMQPAGEFKGGNPSAPLLRMHRIRAETMEGGKREATLSKRKSCEGARGEVPGLSVEVVSEQMCVPVLLRTLSDRRGTPAPKLRVSVEVPLGGVVMLRSAGRRDDQAANFVGVPTPFWLSRDTLTATPMSS